MDWKLGAGLFFLLPGLLFFGCGEPQKPAAKTPPYRIGILLGVNAFQPTVDGFKAGLGEKGYKEGQNVVYDLQVADGNEPRMQEIGRRFVTQEMDLIFATPTGAVKSAWPVAQKASIPLVFANSSGLVRLGFIKSYTVPEIGITGVYSRLEKYIAKRLEILKQLSPETKSIWIPHNPSYPTAVKCLPALKAAADQLGLVLYCTEVTRAEDVVSAVGNIQTPTFDAILTFPDTTVQSTTAWESLLSFARKHRLPIVANTVKQAEKGALFCYRYSAYESGLLAASLAKKMLEGGGAIAIPMIKTQPHLVLNLKAAGQIGLEIDPVMLDTAWKLIR